MFANLRTEIWSAGRPILDPIEWEFVFEIRQVVGRIVSRIRRDQVVARNDVAARGIVPVVVCGPIIVMVCRFVPLVLRRDHPWTSPEQLSGNRSQIGVSTDIYAIGVMLYQALTGQFPYRVEGAIPKVIDDVLNALPTRPSEFNPKISANLDAVVLKALEKSPDTRYSSATDFARDLQSLLDGEPILAVRERTRRNLVNAIRRYRLLTGALVVFIGVVTILYSQAHTDRSIAKRESLKAHASSEFLVDLLAEVDPRRRGVDVTVAEVLNKAAIDIPNRFADQPEVQSTLEFMNGF